MLLQSCNKPSKWQSCLKVNKRASEKKDSLYIEVFPWWCVQSACVPYLPESLWVGVELMGGHCNGQRAATVHPDNMQAAGRRLGRRLNIKTMFPAIGIPIIKIRRQWGHLILIMAINPSHKSHNALDKYPTMPHFVPEMCTFLLQNGALWDMGLVHCGICVTGLFLYW